MGWSGWWGGLVGGVGFGGGGAAWQTGAMTIIETPANPASTDPETREVEAAIDALLAAHDPKTTDNIEFRGARYDAGLAWVHFPKGSGGRELRPELNRLVDKRLRAAGAMPTDPVTFFMALAGPTIATRCPRDTSKLRS